MKENKILKNGLVRIHGWNLIIALLEIADTGEYKWAQDDMGFLVDNTVPLIDMTDTIEKKLEADKKVLAAVKDKLLQGVVYKPWEDTLEVFDLDESIIEEYKSTLKELDYSCYYTDTIEIMELTHEDYEVNDIMIYVENEYGEDYEQLKTSYKEDGALIEIVIWYRYDDDIAKEKAEQWIEKKRFENGKNIGKE